jgi:hypothetical protein
MLFVKSFMLPPSSGHKKFEATLFSKNRLISFYPEDGGSMFLRHIGKLITTRHQIQGDAYLYSYHCLSASSMWCSATEYGTISGGTSNIVCSKVVYCVMCVYVFTNYVHILANTLSILLSDMDLYAALIMVYNS